MEKKRAISYYTTPCVIMCNKSDLSHITPQLLHRHLCNKCFFVSLYFIGIYLLYIPLLHILHSITHSIRVNMQKNEELEMEEDRICVISPVSEETNNFCQ